MASIRQHIVIVTQGIRTLSGYNHFFERTGAHSEHHWETDPNYHPCEYHNSLYSHDLEFFSKELSNGDPRASATTLGELYEIVNLCHHLYSQYRKLPSMSYSDVLRSAKASNGDVFDAIRLEASRALLSAVNGDLLRMAINTIQGVQGFSPNSTRLKLDMLASDFAFSNRNKFRNASQRLFEFLMAPAAPSNDEEPFYSGMSVAAAVEAATRDMYANKMRFNNTIAVPNGPDGSDGSSSLVNEKSLSTNSSEVEASSALSQHERFTYTQRLRSDSILGGILSLVKSIIDHASPPTQEYTAHRSVGQVRDELRSEV